MLGCSGWLTPSYRRARLHFSYLVPVVLGCVAWTVLAIGPSAVPTALAAPPAQCADRKDNDGDAKIDLADPGCVNSADNDETDLAGR
jgi:hypothetical protein